MNARRRFRCCDEERNQLTRQTNHNSNKTIEKEKEVHKTREKKHRWRQQISSNSRLHAIVYLCFYSNLFKFISLYHCWPTSYKEIFLNIKNKNIACKEERRNGETIRMKEKRYWKYFALPKKKKRFRSAKRNNREENTDKIAHTVAWTLMKCTKPLLLSYRCCRRLLLHIGFC